jgi:hypothetical protein
MGSSKKSNTQAVAAATPIDPAAQLQMFDALNKSTSGNTENQLSDLQEQLKKLKGQFTPGLLQNTQNGAQDFKQQLAGNLMRMFGGG